VRQRDESTLIVYWPPFVRSQLQEGESLVRFTSTPLENGVKGKARPACTVGAVVERRRSPQNDVNMVKRGVFRTTFKAHVVGNGYTLVIHHSWVSSWVTEY